MNSINIHIVLAHTHVAGMAKGKVWEYAVAAPSGGKAMEMVAALLRDSAPDAAITLRSAEPGSAVRLLGTFLERREQFPAHASLVRHWCQWIDADDGEPANLAAMAEAAALRKAEEAAEAKGLSTSAGSGA